MQRLLRSPTNPLMRTCAPLLVLLACGDTHGPRAGDTNTSWLKACTVARDCGPEGRCIHNLCTLPCTVDEASICQRISASASCNADTGACDVLCVSGSECRGLGDDFGCEANSCRQQQEGPEVRSQTLRVYPASETLPPDLRLLQMDTAWVGDHWRVVSQASGPGLVPHQGLASQVTSLVVADVYPDERVEQQLVTTEGLKVVTTKGVVVGDDGSIFEWAGGSLPMSMSPVLNDTCQLRFYDPTQLSDVHTLPVSCSDELEGLGVDPNGDWLIQHERANATTSELRLGRYRARERRWLVEPQGVTRVNERMLGLSLQLYDERIWLYWQRPGATSLLTSLPVSAELAPDMLPVDAWEPLYLDLLQVPIGDDGFLWTRYSDGWLVPSSSLALSSPWVREDQRGRYHTLAVPVDSTARPLAPVSFELGPLPSPYVPLQPALQALRAIPGRDLVALCYRESNRVSGDSLGETLKLALFEPAGALRAGPWELASSLQGLEDCKLSWSGTALLATWIEGRHGDGAASYARIITPQLD